MDYELKELCKKFINTQSIIKENFKWSDSNTISTCAFLFINLERTVESSKLKEVSLIFKNNVGIFSQLRGNCKNLIISLMSLTSNPEKKLNSISSMYKTLKNYFPGSDYLVLASALISELVEVDDYDKVFLKAKNIYTRMKKLHRFITSNDDIVMCLLLSLSDMTEDEIINNTEKCFDLLKPIFKDSNSRQHLSHILTLSGGNIEDKCSKVMELYNILKEEKIKHGTTFELATLGLLASTNLDNTKLKEDFISVNNYLQEYKEYSIFRVAPKTRYMHIAMLLSKHYNLDKTTNISISSSLLLNLITMQQANSGSTAIILMSTM